MATSHRNNALDGVRALSAVGIILMHVLANGGYGITGFVGEQMIPSFTSLVFLFMIVSGYVMCCGYYDKIWNKTVSFESFFGRRIAKIWPFFALLSLLDLAISPSANSLYEVFANLTLCFGFLPNANISVIGVGWFIGLVFVFYLTFPFFCYLLANRKRAWFSFAVALVFNYLCRTYFGATKENIVFSAVFFLAGGLLYLYKSQLEAAAKKCRWVIWLAIVALCCVYYLLPSKILLMLILFSLMIVYTMAPQGKYRILSNPVMRFLGDISLEIYLSHMVIFRLLEKAGVTKLFASDVLSFAVTAVATILGTVAFSYVCKKMLDLAEKLLKKLLRKPKKTEE